MIELAVAGRIKLIGFDVDGTLTDGGLYIGAAGGQPVELKRFDIQDGLGVKLLTRAGLLTAVVTARAGEAARIRSSEMGVDEFVISGGHKLPAFEAILQKRQVRWEEVCFIGDDLPDLPILRQVGLPVAVADACKEVKEAARYTTAAGGGHGAVRELAETFLKARGVWNEVVRAYLRERGDVTAR
ncbi:MAG: HAD hydrolase family protein [Gemmatimonadales bacterium]|nr:HAD hydrolase family protein [Gemmatimonadales bacterium]